MDMDERLRAASPGLRAFPVPARAGCRRRGRPVAWRVSAGRGGASHLRNDVLEDLRLLTNFAMDAEQRLCLILVGLTELRRRLAMAMHESLAQRLVVRHHLTGLDRDEVDAYLTHRLRLAGCELPLFEPPAVEALFQSARGLPRQINRIAHYALSAAALAEAKTVNAEHLQHALEELQP